VGMAVTRLKMSNRFSRDAYEILMKIHPNIRSDILSDIVVKAEKSGWIDKIKQLYVEKVLEEIGMTVEEVAAIRPSAKTAGNESLPADKTGSTHRFVPETNEQEKSLQEKLDKNIFL
jgi:hypothetical protein